MKSSRIACEASWYRRGLQMEIYPPVYSKWSVSALKMQPTMLLLVDMENRWPVAPKRWVSVVIQVTLFTVWLPAE
jgi:hypothetical protein